MAEAIEGTTSARRRMARSARSPFDRQGEREFAALGLGEQARSLSNGVDLGA
jgi:hypothetical protein